MLIYNPKPLTEKSPSLQNFYLTAKAASGRREGKPLKPSQHKEIRKTNSLSTSSLEPGTGTARAVLWLPSGLFSPECPKAGGHTLRLRGYFSCLSKQVFIEEKTIPGHTRMQMCLLRDKPITATTLLSWDNSPGCLLCRFRWKQLQEGSRETLNYWPCL